MRAIVFALIMSTHAVLASGQTLTASCKNPTGRALGVLGEIANDKPVDDTESMQGGVITLTWRTGQPKANLVVNTGAAGSVSSAEGQLVFRTEDQLTFLATFPGAAYMVSVFLSPKRMLVSAHQQFLGAVPGSALAKTYQSKCEISIQ